MCVCGTSVSLKHNLLYDLTPQSLIEASYERRARNHQLVAQRCRRQVNRHHALTHSPAYRIAIYASPHNAWPQSRGPVLIKLVLKVLLLEEIFYYIAKLASFSPLHVTQCCGRVGHMCRRSRQTCSSLRSSLLLFRRCGHDWCR